MEVTSENFSNELPRILEAIRSASFLSFDCEFSGLGRGGAAISAYETPELLYHKWKTNVGNFMVMQFGLCAFRYDADNNQFKYSCFSCYVFPKLPHSLRGLRNCLSDQFTNSFQTDCLDFLASQNFDFNKWISKGVGYLRPKDVEKLREDVTRKHTWRHVNAQASASQSPVVPDTVKPKMNQILKKVQSYIEKSGATNKNAEPLKLAGLTAFERRLVYQSLEHMYGMQLFIESSSPQKGDQHDVTMLIRKCLTKEEHESLRQQKLQGELNLLNQALGFSTVISEITKSGKPLIGHNMNLDLLHTFKAFCADLPQTWRQFKSAVREFFPVILDTKVLAAQQPLKAVVGTNSSLRELLQRVNAHPFTKVKCVASSEERGYSEEGSIDLEQLHNAGFDAFATGKLFLAMASYFGDYKCPSRKTIDIPWDLLRPHANKLTTGKAQDMPYMCLTGEDETIDRSHVFFIRTHDEEWTNKEIIALFSPYGPVQIHWVHRPKNSAFVCLVKRDQAKSAFVGLLKTAAVLDAKWRIQPAQEFLDSQEREILGENLWSGAQVLGKRTVSQETMDTTETTPKTTRMSLDQDN